MKFLYICMPNATLQAHRPQDDVTCNRLLVPSMCVKSTATSPAAESPVTVAPRIQNTLKNLPIMQSNFTELHKG